MSENDYKNELQINQNALDEELIKQPSLFMKYAELSAQARFKRDKAKEYLDLKRAELDGKIRESPAKFGYGGDKKLTEAAISNIIIASDEFKAAQTALNEAALDTGILEAAREAFNHKKSALENLVRLWLGGYWSEAKVPKNVTAEHEAERVNREHVKILNENERLQELKEKRRRLLDD